MSKLEACDKVLGDGSGFFVTAGGYKDGEKTRYRFGFKLNLPSFIAALTDGPAKQYATRGVYRVVSVDAAGSFNKGNDFGAAEDAEAFYARYQNDAAFVTALESKRQPRTAKEKMPSIEVQVMDQLVTLVLIQRMGFTADNFSARADNGGPSKEQKAEAKTKVLIWKVGNHPNWKRALKKAQDKLTDKLED